MKLRTAVLILLALLLLGAVLLAWAYIAGYTYYLLNKAWPQQVDPQTWYVYWQAYAQDPGQRKRLLAAAALPGLLLLAFLLIALAPLCRRRTRPLYGDARWATEREIKDEGLL